MTFLGSIFDQTTQPWWTEEFKKKEQEEEGKNQPQTMNLLMIVYAILQYIWFQS